jgi:hypothetical protein
VWSAASTEHSCDDLSALYSVVSLGILKWIFEKYAGKLGIGFMAVRPIQPPTQGVPRALSPEIKWKGHEADHSPPSSAEVKNTWRYNYRIRSSGAFL